jgi:hypothetical protein
VIKAAARPDANTRDRKIHIGSFDFAAGFLNGLSHLQPSLARSLGRDKA